jgi:serine/threonine-protein kinase
MTPDRWRRIEELYQAALQHPAHGRAAFLAEACAGDEALRRDIDSLLAQHPSANNDYAQRVTESISGRSLLIVNSPRR